MGSVAALFVSVPSTDGHIPERKDVKQNLKPALCLIYTICLPEEGWSWELSNYKEDCHLLGVERQGRGCFFV